MNVFISTRPRVRTYIDDFNLVEKVDKSTGLTHFTQDKPSILLYAEGSEEIFKELGQVRQMS